MLYIAINFNQTNKISYDGSTIHLDKTFDQLKETVQRVFSPPDDIVPNFKWVCDNITKFDPDTHFSLVCSDEWHNCRQVFYVVLADSCPSKVSLVSWKVNPNIMCA